MRGNEKVIAELNSALRAELTAIVQYMVQSEFCQNWGYTRLGAILKKRAIEEMGHAEGLIERLVFLDAVPEVKIGLTPELGQNVKAQLESDLKDELDSVRNYNASVKVCREASDDGTRELFVGMIHDEEVHADFLEAQLHSIGEIGLPAYLSQQLHAEN